MVRSSMSFGRKFAVARMAMRELKTDIAPREMSLSIWNCSWKENFAMKAELPMTSRAKIKRKKNTFCLTSSVKVLAAMARVAEACLIGARWRHAPR